jgi:DNA replication protein DnaC
MKPTIEVYLGGPIQEQSEKDFLLRIKNAFRQENRNAIIFASFFARTRQIDFFLITDNCACLVELKAFIHRISGNTNGYWLQHLPDGTSKEIGNPYLQALQCKFALSDEVKKLLVKDSSIPKLPGNREFFREIESVVCIYPRVPEGSEVPGDFKVTICGFEDLWNLVSTTNRCPKWDRKHWETLAMSLGLIKEDNLSTLRDFSQEEAHKAIKEFKERFIEHFEADLTPLIPTSLKSGKKKGDVEELRSFLLKRKHGRLLGQAGCGKTHLALHMALYSIKNGQIVIFSSAKNYEGSLNSLLNKSISYLHSGNLENFLNLCSKTSTSTALIIDGFNDCPFKFQKDLLKDIQGFYLRNPMPVLITSQVELALPADLSGETYYFNDLTQEEKRKIFESYSSTYSYDVLKNILDPFNTALEISLAAVCAAEIQGEFLSRAELYEKYSRRCLRNATNSIAVRQLLITLADTMAKRLVKSLALSEVERIGLPSSDLSLEHLTVFNEALDSALLKTKEDRCYFRHELFQHFFEALAFLRDFRKPTTLAATLKLPRYSHIQELIIGLLEDEESVKECLLAISDVRIMRNALLGHLGNLARNIIIRDASALIRRAFQDLENINFQQTPSEDGLIDHLQVEGAATWTQYDQALMEAIGQVMGPAHFMDEIFYLVRKTDQASQKQLLEKEGSLKGSSLSQLFAGLYIFGPDRPQGNPVLPASNIVRAYHNNFSPSQKIQEEKLVPYCKQLEERTPGELYLICLTHRQLRSEIDEPKSFEGLRDFLCSLIRVCWESNIYHLQLEMLIVIQLFRNKMSDALLEEVKSMLSNLHTNNLMLSTQLVQTCFVYDLVDSPIGVDEVGEEIKAILQSPDCSETWINAYRSITRMFEEIFPAYYEIITNLPQRDKIRLYTLAALGAPDYGFFPDWLLIELLKFKDPEALPAFRKWATELNPDSLNLRETIVCYVTACVGCSHFMDWPLKLKSLTSDDYLAWQTYGEIIFWVNKPDLYNNDEINQRCNPLWEKLHAIPFEAIDPLMRLKTLKYGMFSNQIGDPIETIYNRFREQIRKLLEFGLKNRTQLSTLFIRHQPLLKKELTSFLIFQLGEIGNLSTINILEPFIESPEFGNLAIRAVKNLKGHVTN